MSQLPTSFWQQVSWWAYSVSQVVPSKIGQTETCFKDKVAADYLSFIIQTRR